MPNDIFISYSHADASQAVALCTRLRHAGHTVWVDQQSITGADAWSKEIVQGIGGCSVFLVLLSASSLISQNVIKELSLAAEEKKHILPIELEPVAITDDFKYHLAGIHRIAYTNHDGILRALGKLGIPKNPLLFKEGAGGGSPRLEKAGEDMRKSLMVMPFEDLSPSGEDNIWFADGLMSELIDALSNIKSLRLIDQKTSRDFRNVKVKITDIAKEYDIRYFIQGSVRKFGEQIKISLELLDIETGDHLWQHSHRGAFSEIFDIQEAIAEKVVEGLKINLTKEEEKKIETRGTENAEAYEYYLRGKQFFTRQTKEGLEYALPLYHEAIRIDPNFAEAYVNAAFTLLLIYSSYDRAPARLQEAERLLDSARELKPSFHYALGILSRLRLHQGKPEEALSIAKQYVALEPDDYMSHFRLAFLYSEMDQNAEAIAEHEEVLRLAPENIGNYWNLTISYSKIGDKNGRIRTALRALPLYEKSLRLFPDDERLRVEYASFLYFADLHEEAADALKKITGIKDGVSLYNLACLALNLQMHDLAMEHLKSAFATGFAQVELLHTDPELDPLREREDFQALVKEVSEPLSEP